MFQFLMSSLLIWMSSLACADESLQYLDVGRGGATAPIYVMTRPDAIATLILLPGGDSSLGTVTDGRPGNENFLSRSRSFFYAQNFNVIVAYRASDLTGLSFIERTSKTHIAEIEKIVGLAKDQFGKPVWLIGTSRGSVSAAAAAITLGSGVVQGLVLSSSVTSQRPGAVPSQAIGTLGIPVLVVHHKNDACRICIPYEAAKIVDDLKSAPAKKFIMVEGGQDPMGDPCSAKHWHGYINFERETVKLMTEWIKKPRTD